MNERQRVAEQSPSVERSTGGPAGIPDPVDTALAALVDAASDSDTPTTGGAPAADGPRVLDLGGGSGTRAVPLAARGCRVTVADTSVDALAILRRRAVDAGVADRVTAVQADAEQPTAVVPPGSIDLVICHHLLESVDDPASVLHAAAAALRPGGRLSLLVPSRWGMVVRLVLAGRSAAALTLMDDPDGRFGPSDPLHRRFERDHLTGLLSAAGLDIESCVGVGGVAGLTAGPPRSLASADEAALPALAAAFSTSPVLREIAPDLHLVARRRAGAS